jgi:hypothetical protein
MPEWMDSEADVAVMAKRKTIPLLGTKMPLGSHLKYRKRIYFF